LPEEGAFTKEDFINQSALKRVRVQFWWKNKYGYQTACSSDSFAIRPKSFKITAPSTYKAGKDINITFSAVDGSDNNTTNYNEDLNVTVSEKKSSCKLDTNFNFSGSFTDGGVSFTKSYSEVGEVDINISETLGHEFAIVDSNDTPKSQRLISKDTKSISFTPAKFSLDWDYKNHNYSNTANYTYYSNNPKKMGSRLFAKIKVLNDKDEVLTNYVEACYAKPTAFKFSFDVNTSVAQTMKLKVTDINDSSHTLAEADKSITNNMNININYTIAKNKFINGERNETIAINFDRKTNIAYAPLRLTAKSVSVDNGDINKTETASKVSTFIYAKAHVQNSIEVVGDELNATVDYEVYIPTGISSTDYNLPANLPLGKDSIKEWYILPSDISCDFVFPSLRYPNATTTVLKESSTLIKVEAEKLPEKNRVIYKPESFLLYNENRPNGTITSHNFIYKLLSPTNTWSGKGKEGKVFDDRASQKTIKRLNW
jgi:hypothetical protein